MPIQPEVTLEYCALHEDVLPHDAASYIDVEVKQRPTSVLHVLRLHTHNITKCTALVHRLHFCIYLKPITSRIFVVSIYFDSIMVNIFITMIYPIYIHIPIVNLFISTFLTDFQITVCSTLSSDLF
jgi:hypothetical protein